jgi:hypothetical protein
MERGVMKGPSTPSGFRRRAHGKQVDPRRLSRLLAHKLDTSGGGEDSQAPAQCLLLGVAVRPCPIDGSKSFEQLRHSDLLRLIAVPPSRLGPPVKTLQQVFGQAL